MIDDTIPVKESEFRQDMVPSQSYFQHRNGLQLSAAAQSAAASRPDLNGFQPQQQDFNYPKDPYRYTWIRGQINLMQEQSMWRQHRKIISNGKLILINIKLIYYSSGGLVNPVYGVGMQVKGLPSPHI